MRARDTYSLAVRAPASVAAYLAAAPRDKRAALERLRRVIKAAAPTAAERLAYGIVGFKYEGKPLIYIGYAADHCAIYGDSSFLNAHPDLFKRFERTKGSVQFPPDRPISDRLLTRMIKSRMKEIDAGRGTSYSRRGARARG